MPIWPYIQSQLILNHSNPYTPWHLGLDICHLSTKDYLVLQHIPQYMGPLLLCSALLCLYYQFSWIPGCIHRNGKAVRVTALIVTGDAEACLQRLQWRSGQSSWRPFPVSVTYILHEWFCCVIIWRVFNISSWSIGMSIFTIFLRVASLSLGQSQDCPSASEVILKLLG